MGMQIYLFILTLTWWPALLPIEGMGFRPWGKAASNFDYNPKDPTSVYNNAIVNSHLTKYTSMAKQVHGLDYDPLTHDLDGEVVMRVGGGKKHR
jgi:hypothetical protein